MAIMCSLAVCKARAGLLVAIGFGAYVLIG
jgi:hypothetical protein